MINKDSDIEIIISKYLSKEATAEDIKILEDWISATPENYRSFLSQKNVWEVSHPAFNPEEIDVDSAHRKVMEQILHPNQPVSVRPKLSFLHYWQQVAAILLLPLLILSAYLYFKPASQIAETYQELFTPYGTWSVVNLPDGSKVWLNANSKLVYPTAFIEKERTVFLEGEAYFKVTKDAKPFIVKTDYLQTKVLGTEFNVKSYTAEDSHVTLISGKVQVRSHENARFVDLEPGKDAMLLSDGLFEVKEVNSEAYTYWKDGYFYFDELPLADIMKSIGRWYNVNVTFRNKEAMAYRIHFMSNRQSGIEETIRLMNRLKKVTLTLCENTVYVD